MKTEIVALKGKVYSKSFSLASGGKLLIGRGPDSDIQILDAGLSRNHCSLERIDDTFYITDLDSRNGTFVNGKRVTRREIKPNDVISLGGIDFQFRCVPERRRQEADLIATLPEKLGHGLKERLDLSHSDLMVLPEQFQNVENYRRIQRDLATIYRVGNMISAESDLHALYDRVLDAIFEVVKPDRAFLLLAGERPDDLRTVAQRGQSPVAQSNAAAGFSTTIANECFSEGVSILRADALLDEQFGRAESVICQNIHSVIAVPIETPEKIIGVIYADNVAQSEAFARHDLELLTAVGKQAGVAIQRAQFARQLRNLLHGAVSALVATIEAKDEYTRGHSDRVTSYARQLGRALNLSSEELDTLELAGFLHDVGKIGVPEDILRKPGPLTAEETVILRQHPKIGYNIISNIEGAEQIARIVLHHHEQWDGNGYPCGAGQTESPLLARILAVADAFDAMNSLRPYRKALHQRKILDEIRKGAGTQFDPHLVELFLAEYEAGRMTSDDTAPLEEEPG